MMKYRQLPAYLTVYMAITVLLFISLSLTLIEGVRSNAIRLEAECIVDMGLNSIMAEYHRELQEQYNIFAIDASYGSGVAAKKNTEQHFKQYLDRNMSLNDIFLSEMRYRDFLAMSAERVELSQISILTDNKGDVFRKLAVDAVWHDIGLGRLEELEDWLEIIEEQQLLERDVPSEKTVIDEEIMEYDGMEIEISEEETVIVEIENPTDVLENKRQAGVLAWVVDNVEELSTETLETEALMTTRIQEGNIQRGNMEWETDSDNTQLLERFWFQEYLLRYMAHYGKQEESDVLKYQMEYILSGHDCDMENLKGVVHRLCALREVANTLYLFSDEEKCAEVDLLATGLASAMLVPEISPLLKASILLGWAYAESLYDVEILLKGGRVPLKKSADTWHYGLAAALSGEKGESSLSDTEGLSYEDYLRIFLMFCDLETMTMRAMDMVETDIRHTVGNAGFQMDGCYVALEATVDISSGYGYENQITRQKKYK